jgi:hypothetical protein
MADNVRSIPSVVDGFKPGQRKVLFGCFNLDLVLELALEATKEDLALAGLEAVDDRRDRTDVGVSALEHSQPGTYMDHDVDEVPISDFINKELILFQRRGPCTFPAVSVQVPIHKPLALRARTERI